MLASRASRLTTTGLGWCGCRRGLGYFWGHTTKEEIEAEEKRRRDGPIMAWQVKKKSEEFHSFMLLLVYISTYGIRRLVDDFCPGSATCLQSSHGKNEFNKCHCIFRTPSPTWSKPIKRLHTFQCELKPRKEPLRRRPGA